MKLFGNLLFLSALCFAAVLFAEEAEGSVEEEVIEVEEEEIEEPVPEQEAAAEKEAEEKKEETLSDESEDEIVVTADKIKTSEVYQAEKKTVVGETEIRESGAKNLGDAMGNQLGVQVSRQAYSNRGSPQGIQIQGCEPSRVLILVDGKKVIGNSDGIVDASQLPLNDVEKIEIIKGSSSAEYGSDAICGVVNIITKKHAGKNNFSGKAEYGSYHHRAFNAALKHAIGKKSDLKLSTGYYGTEGYDLDKSNRTTDGERKNSANAGIALTLRPATGWEIGIDGDFFYENKDRKSAFRKGDNPTEYLSKLTSEVFRGGGEIYLKYNFNKTDLIKLKVYDNYFRKNYTDDLVKSPEVSRRFTDNNLVETTLDGKVLLGTWNYLSGGFLFNYEWLDDTKKSTEIIDSETVEEKTGTNVDNKTVWNTAVFVQDEMTPFEWWTIIPGIRFSYNENFSYTFTPKLAMKFYAHKRVALNASYGMGYKTPTLKHLYYTFEHSVFGNIIGVNGNPDLKPETSHSVNAGIDVIPYADESLISLAGYFNQYFDFIDIDYDNAEWIGGNSYYTYKNISKARTYGLESAFRFPFAEYFMLTGGYSLLFAENMDSGKRLPHRPMHQAKGSFRFHHKKWGVSANISGMYQSHVFADAENTIKSSQFFLLNAYIEKSFLDETLRLYICGNNLTNVRRNVNDSNDLRPQPGIEVLGGISWDYSWKKSEKNQENKND